MPRTLLSKDARIRLDFQKRWKRNLNYQPSKKNDVKKTYTLNNWYKRRRGKIK